LLFILLFYSIVNSQSILLHRMYWLGMELETLRQRGEDLLLL